MYKLLLSLFLVSVAGYAWAANYSDPMDGIFRGVYGDTISLEVPSLVTKSPVTDTDESGALSFKFNSDTGYRNFRQLSDLKNGDRVRIEYTQDVTSKNKDMIATIITKLDSTVVVTPVSAPARTIIVTRPATQTVTTTTTRINPE